MAKNEATQNGCDEAIMLNEVGRIACEEYQSLSYSVVYLASLDLTILALLVSASSWLVDWLHVCIHPEFQRGPLSLSLSFIFRAELGISSQLAS